MSLLLCCCYLRWWWTDKHRLEVCSEHPQWFSWLCSHCLKKPLSSGLALCWNNLRWIVLWQLPCPCWNGCGACSCFNEHITAKWEEASHGDPAVIDTSDCVRPLCSPQYPLARPYAPWSSLSAGRDWATRPQGKGINRSRPVTKPLDSLAGWQTRLCCMDHTHAHIHTHKNIHTHYTLHTYRHTQGCTRAHTHTQTQKTTQAHVKRSRNTVRPFQPGYTLLSPCSLP